MAKKTKLIKIGIGVLAGFFVVRVCVLVFNTSQLIHTSSSFPTEYSVGSGSKKITYLALGDSTVVGTGCTSCEQSLPYLVAKQIADQDFTVKVVNHAVVGAKIGDVEANQIGDIDQIKPDIITLNIGSNDATHFTNYIDYGKSLKNVLIALTKNPKTAVMVASTPDLSPVPAMYPFYCDITAWRAREQNKILTNMIAGSKIKLIDLFTDGKLQGTDYYASDDFHPSPEGYAVWAKLYKPDADSKFN